MYRLLAAAQRHCPPLPQRWRSLAASSSSAATRDVQETLVEKLAALKAAMADAVESAEMVGPSANQLLLETDPAARGPREQYELHYSEMALIQIQNALEMKELMVEEFGREAVTALLREEKVSVLAADVLLWRDKTSAIIATVRSHQDSNTVECPK